MRPQLLAHLLQGLFLHFLLQTQDICDGLLGWFGERHIEGSPITTRRRVWHQRDDFPTTCTRRRKDSRRTEIVRDGFFCFFTTLAHDPQDHEEGHHSGDEISVGHFPRPPVVPTVPLLDDLFNDGCLLPTFCHTVSFLVTERIFHLFETGTYIRKDGAAGKLHRDNRRRIIGECQ